MTAPDSALPQEHRPRRIPLWVKLAYTLFVGTLVPIYLHDYGPTNFLYYCDVALLMTLVAIWREDSLWASMPAVGILLPQSFWMADFLGRMIGLPFCGMTAYMFDSGIPLFTRGLSFFHFWLPLFLVWILWRLGYDRRAWRAWTVLAWGLMLYCYFVMPGPSEELSKAGVPVNINYVYGMSDTEPQHAMPPLAYLGLLLVVLPLAVYLPTHLVLRSVFCQCVTPLSGGAETAAPATGKLQGSRFRFRLATLLAPRRLLVLVTVCAILCSWFPAKRQQAKREREASDAIRELGGSSCWLAGGEPYWVELGFCTHVDSVTFNSENEMADDGAQHLKDLGHLQGLSLDHTQVTDAGLEQLKGLGQLRILSLDGVQVTDAGLEHLKGLTQLQTLDLSRTQVTDAGLVHLKELTQLQNLYLTGATITDAGLVHLKGLTQLQKLFLQGTQVTDVGVAELQKTLAKCEIGR